MGRLSYESLVNRQHPDWFTAFPRAAECDGRGVAAIARLAPELKIAYDGGGDQVLHEWAARAWELTDQQRAEGWQVLVMRAGEVPHWIPYEPPDEP